VLIAPLALLLLLADPPAPTPDAVPASAPAPDAASVNSEPAPGPAVAAAPQETGSGDPEGLSFVWRDHPSLRAGKWLRLDFGAKLQGLLIDPGDDPVDFDKAQFSRGRFGIDGELFKVIQFSIEREFTSASIAASFSQRRIDSTGPKISSRAMRMSGVTSANTVGSR